MDNLTDIVSSNIPSHDGEIVLYQPNAQLRLEVAMNHDSVWLNLNQMAYLFNRDKSVISRHIRAVFSEGELPYEGSVAKNATVQKEGEREVVRQVEYYNLNVIISVGYRVKSQQGTAFRIWATGVLKEYMLRGYAINQRLLAMEERIDNRLIQHERILAEHQEKIDFFVRTNLPPVEQVFFNGEFWEARVLLERLIKTATKRVIIIDTYIDASDFSMLDVRQKGVTASIYSHKDFADLRDLHNAQPNTEPVETFVWAKPSHDCWLIVDDTVYHCGHSLKDMGKKLCYFQMGCDTDTNVNKSIDNNTKTNANADGLHKMVYFCLI